jgi:putative membrane protein
MATFTTASDPARADFRGDRWLQAIVGTLAALWLVLAIEPVDRRDWLLENLLVLALVISGLVTYRRWPFSDLSYTLIALFLALHLIGAHYTYVRVPAGFWLQEWLGLSRNHFDRVAHFAFGLLVAYPMRELLSRWSAIRPGWVPVTAFAVIVAASDVFELLEWMVAEIVSPETATVYLGMQGDPFDAQKDIVLAHAGAIIGLSVAAIVARGKRAVNP